MRKQLIGIITVGLVAGIASSAAAIDGKVYPGATCRAELSHHETSTSRLLGRITNDSATQRPIYTCPIVRDVVGGSINRILVHVIDQNFDDNVGCEFATMLPSDTGARVWSTRFSSGTNANPQTLTGPSTAPPSGAYEYVACRVPMKYNNVTSKVISYQVDEND